MESTFLLTPQDLDRSPPELLHAPPNPMQSHVLYLSNIDQPVAFPVESLFIFTAPRGDPSETDDVGGRLRQAVEVLLMRDYYFLAGRLRLEDSKQRLELVCNNGGVLFTTASCRLRLSELGDVSRPNPSFQHLIMRMEGFGELSESPVFTIQVTRFSCGGYSIGFVMNHSILDGRAAADMFAVLATICRGEDASKYPPPYNDRTCLKPRNPPQIDYLHEELAKLPDAVSSFTSAAQPMLPSSRLQLSSTHSSKVFPFTADMLSALKLSSGLPRCSSFEALVAHIWRSRTKAVFHSHLDSTSSVLFAVDFRSKVHPPLPANFAGNAVASARATALVADIEANSLRFCTEKVREAGEAITDDYVRSMVDWLEVHRGVPRTGGGGFYVSAWWKLPFHELDFGHGKALFGGPVASGMDEFVLLLADGSRGGGVRVWIVLEKGQMERFEAVVYQI